MNIHSLQAVPARLAQVRAVMAREHLDAYIVLSSDPHLSEYPPARWQSRAFLSGFTGSAGTLIVTNDFAGVWVDSRYWTQAETQLAGSGAARMKSPRNPRFHIWTGCWRISRQAEQLASMEAS